jgi:glycerol kinase
MPKYILAIDQGTTGTTTMVVDEDGRIRGRAYGEIQQFYPRPGWVEHEPDEIYRSVINQGRAALAEARVKAGELAAIGITNQRETFAVWERATGRPLYRAIVWQCRRSAEICERLREREPEIARHTGLLVDPYFSGTKLKWLLDSDRALSRQAARGEVCFGTIDSWLIFRLSRGAAFVTDFTNASRTMLMNLEQRQWDPVMLEMLGVPGEMLPKLTESRGPLAETVKDTIADHPVPIAAAIGDQQAALFGQGCVRPGDAKVTYGTGAFLLASTGQNRPRSQNRLLATAALGPRGEPALALEGSVFIAGAVIQWLRDELKMIAQSADSSAIAHESRDRSQPYVVPAFVGLGAPYWDSDARGAIVGITRGTTRADIVRAALDSIAYQVHEVIEAMEQDLGKRISTLRVDGGAAANDYLMQFQADLIRRQVMRPRIAETTVLGAALLAGLAVGLWRSPADIADLTKIERTFKPSMKERERVQLLNGWRAAVNRVLTSTTAGKRPAPS